MKRLVLLLSLFCLGTTSLAMDNPNPPSGLIDRLGKHYTLSPKQHQMLLNCSTYAKCCADNKTDTINFERGPSSATHQRLMQLVKYMQDPQQLDLTVKDTAIIDLFELADYLDAPDKIKDGLACKFLETFKEHELNQEEKDIHKTAQMRVL